MLAYMFGCNLQLTGYMVVDKLPNIPGSICKREIEPDAGATEDVFYPWHLPEPLKERNQCAMIG